MKNHKEVARKLTLEELRIYENEYRKRLRCRKNVRQNVRQIKPKVSDKVSDILQTSDISDTSEFPTNVSNKYSQEKSSHSEQNIKIKENNPTDLDIWK